MCPVRGTANGAVGVSMRLERLEINGFKSFSDRSELAFDKGVTAIVGPNGCGKSNVADAITWVMGEQSAKSLRGERMEDVIFSGSDARKPTASAEVRLRFSGVLRNVTGPAFRRRRLAATATRTATAIAATATATHDTSGNGNGNGHAPADDSALGADGVAGHRQRGLRTRSTWTASRRRRGPSRARRPKSSFSRSLEKSRSPGGCTVPARAST